MKKIIKALVRFPLMAGIFPPIEEIKSSEDDGPDYRYWDFRDEIRDVERMKTIGGKNGKEEKEKSKKTSNTPAEDQETA